VVTSKTCKTDTEELKKLQKNKKYEMMLDVRPKKALACTLINQN
jgi:hypothetical protein